jgi:hypothetical protein
MATGTSASNEFEKKILNCLFRGTNITAPTARHMALFTVMPGNDGTGGTEVTGGSYAAINITTLFGTNAAGNPATIANDALIESAVATANWGTIVGFGIYSHATNRAASDCWAVQTLDTTQAINTGGKFTLPVGAFGGLAD